ncbi:MAG TPA: RNB domain-containing ribonuclease [Gaiellales bacterium]|nr:RNB domain-containing ribonuclease [Gaiellales bacterium]
MSPPPARPPVVCEVSLRARAVVGEPFFEPGPPLTLGRVGGVAAGAGDLVAVDVTGPGRGTVAERLGLVTDASAVVHGLALEAGVAAPWPDDVEAEAAALPRDPAPEAGRVDLRAVPTFTIDPADAGDHDDALSADGERVLVHIADVAAFVPEGGAIDREAARRATSVYLPGRVDPMLPDRLSSGLCSLLPGRDRFALTVEIGPGPLRAYRSVIRSDHRLTYDEAEAMLATGEGPAGLVAALRRLDGIARARAAARLARGGVAVETRERSFQLEDGAVVSGTIRRSGPAHLLVEELMLAANEAVAAELAAAGAPMPFRVHEPPEAGALDVLAQRLEALQVPTPPQPPLPTPEQASRFAGLVSQSVSRYVASSGRGRSAFPAMVLRALRKARYDPHNLGHAGLASPAYCHFTSPIRRHPDLLVHRALLRHLGALPTPPPDPVAVAAAAAHDSAAEREAELLERTADDVCAAFLLERELYEQGWDATFAGEVVGVIDSGAFVRFGGLFEGYLPGRSWAGELVDLDPLGVAVVGRRSGRRLRLGDPVEVGVRAVDRTAGRVRIRASHAP